MTQIPLIPDNAPFSAEQRAWLNEFLAGVLKGRATVTSEVGVSNPPSAKLSLLIAFGSQSGNAESLAKRLAREANARGFAARVAGLDLLAPNDLSREKNLLLITSTWGEGDLPDNALSFWDSLNQNGSSPELDHVKYSVLALGDKNYGDTFCLAGKKFDARLAELGAERIVDRVDCDVDCDDLAREWSNAAFSALFDAAGTEVGFSNPPPPSSEGRLENPPSVGTKKNPFPARLLANIELNSPGSSKNTRHVAFSLPGSGLSYEVGDALGVQVQNCPDVVDAIITAQRFDPRTEVALPDGGTTTLREALLKHYEVRHLLGKQPVEGLTLTSLVQTLRKLQPRLYSIASSLKAHPEEVHLCIAAVRYSADGVEHKGVASTFIADRLALGDTTGIFFHTASHFRLPTDLAKPVIMVGPGTGIAPFRAFLQERQVTGASGKNWLFFGDQKRACDFLYRDQLTEWTRQGNLTRLDLAFSRDQEEKIYVQTKMLQVADELWKWLELGAHFYVCGDAKRMAKDVDAALHTLIQTAGGKSVDEAAAYVAQMKQSKRYARDVY